VSKYEYYTQFFYSNVNIREMCNVMYIWYIHLNVPIDFFWREIWFWICFEVFWCWTANKCWTK